MFEPATAPRIFALPCGVNFGQAVVDGLRARLADSPPETIGRTTLILNTTRMQRRIREIFDAGPAGFLPRLQLLTTLDAPGMAGAHAPTSALARRLELLELVRGLLARQPDLAPLASAFDLANSLAGLMDELRDEGRDPSVIAGLDVSDQSGHWQRAQQFLAIVSRFFEADAIPDDTAMQARRIDALIAHWQAHPPTHPVIIAGSTGSRGVARRLMQTVASLPQGAIILPGLDTAMPAHGWTSLRETRGLQEDHPQYRHLALCDALGCAPTEVPMWHDTAPPSPARNALVSLALRPAPVTHAWREEGAGLADLDRATAGLTLVQAQSPREEALAVALRLRAAAEAGQSAALISPDRSLTRLTTMLLEQWGIVPDESAGIPLHLTPPGRFLRHVAEIQGDRLTAEALLILLKHPLCHSGRDRSTHLRHTRDLELDLRKSGPPFPTAAYLRDFGARKTAGPWVAWLLSCLDGMPDPAAALPLPDRCAAHRAMAEALAAGTSLQSADAQEGAETGSGGLWMQLAGAATREVMTRLEEAAPAGGAMTAREYLALFSAILASEQQTDRDAGDPLIRIWGTLEARVMGADLLILGALNEGSWPEAPAPDPWLNRTLRKQAGLLLPERRIGLSAHDFQQAIGGQEVWLTRAVRSDGAQTVPSRWLNRLSNLLGGLEAGRPALEEMTRRGDDMLELARAFERVTPGTAAPRPSPRPPAEARPKKLSVTQIGTLLRDPYAIYARNVLGLEPLDPLVKTADAAMRGTAFHKVFERFVRDGPLNAETLHAIGSEVFDSEVAWPDIRTLWQARLARITEHFLEEEAERQATGTPVSFERRGEMDFAEPGFTLVGKADRIDRHRDGSLAIYDYKTGAPPTVNQQEAFDKQLLLLALMAEEGAFEELDAGAVRKAAFVGIGLSPKTVPAPLDKCPTARTRAEFEEIISAMLRHEFGFTSRRAMQTDRYGGDYDQLARFGEWDTTEDPVPEDLT